jgi:hypothetical protein
MEEFEQLSENTVEVAEPQHLEVQESSENNSEVAEPKTVQDAETNAHYAELRRKQELDEYRSKADEYQQHLNRVAQISGYQSHDELLRALDEAEKQQERERYEQAGIDPDRFHELVNELPEIKQFREMQRQQEEKQRFQDEANELFQEFPQLTPEQIPNEVWVLKEQRGLSLLDAYLRTSFKSLSQQKEQEAIQKLQQNQMSSPGALGQEGSDHKTSYSQLSTQEKAALREKVLRGEATNLL